MNSSLENRVIISSYSIGDKKGRENDKIVEFLISGLRGCIVRVVLSFAFFEVRCELVVGVVSVSDFFRLVFFNKL